MSDVVVICYGEFGSAEFTCIRPVLTISRRACANAGIEAVGLGAAVSVYAAVCRVSLVNDSRISDTNVH